MLEETMIEAAPPQHRAAVYELEDVGKRFGAAGAAVEAVSDVTVTIGAGEFVAVTGPSGSGKTTLLQLLGALESPTRGHVRLAGIDLARMSERQLSQVRRRRIGFVFQQFNLIPTLTARQNVEAPMAGTGGGRAERPA